MNSSDDSTQSTNSDPVTEQMLFDELTLSLTARLGDKAGTFKLVSVDSDLSAARQAARQTLEPGQKATLTGAVEQVRAWLIQRDPEASERVDTGGAAMAPQDIGIAIRAAEDYASATLLADQIDSVTFAMLQSRWVSMTVETMAERVEAVQPKLVWSDRKVRGMALGVGLTTIGLGISAIVSQPFSPLMGAMVFALNYRAWKYGVTKAKVGGSTIKVNSGGSFGRSA
jgi:hypothetical protein